MVTRWPDDRPIAVIVNVAYEAWPADVAPGVSPMGNPLPAGLFDTQAASWGAYGAKVGVERLLGILDETGTRATFMASGILAETQPDSLRRIADAGHEICGHAWTQNVLPATLDPDDEREHIQRCLTALESASGIKPRGWISPRGTPSTSTARISKELGLSWFGDVFDADLPYSIETGSGPIVAIPLHMEINDLPMLMRYGRSPSEFHDETRRLLEHARAAKEPTMFDITVHTHVGGRLAMAGVFREVLLDLRGQSDVWLTTRDVVADWFLTT